MRYGWKPYIVYSNKKSMNKGEVLFSQGEIGTGFYYLAEGKMNIQLVSEDGQERIIDYIEDGYLVGEQGVSGQAYSTTAVCDTDAVLYYFPTETLRRLCKHHPEANEIFTNSVITKIRVLVDTIKIIIKPYEQQMAYYFLQLHKKNNCNPFSITQKSLAKYIGTSRITVYKIMKNWLEDKLISQNGRTIEILDLHKMSALYTSDIQEISIPFSYHHK